MAMTFEVVPSGLEPIGEAPTLADASAALPHGAYTTMRTYGGRRFLRLGHHLRRLQESIGLEMGVPAEAGPVNEAVLPSAIALALQRTAYDESRLRITLAPPRIFVTIEPFVSLPESLYRDGVRCSTLPLRRRQPHAKDTAFIAVADRAYRDLGPGAHEGLIVGDDGAILEGLSSNFFAIRDGELRTEGELALEGVTRAVVLEAAQGWLPVVFRAVRVDELPQVSECFITSASRGLLPVVAVDEQPIADGRPGALTRELKRRFEARIDREVEPV